MSPRLSARLQAVADLVLPGRAMADVGCDHALLAAWCVASAGVPKAIGCDVNVRPLQRARARLDAAGIDRVELRHGSGLSTLRPGEVHTITLAGMGGQLMVELLEAHPDVLASTHRVIVQPNTGWEGVRRHLARRGIPLEAETLTEDGGRLFLTLAFDPRVRGATWDEADVVLGPRLRREQPQAWRRWLSQREAHLRGLLEGLGASLGPEHPRVLAVREELERLQHASLTGP